MRSISVNLLLAFILLALVGPLPTVRAKPSILQRPSSLIRSGTKTRSSKKTKKDDDAYILLARSIQTRLNTPTDSDGSSSSSSPTNHDIDKISSALRSLSTTQAALKKIDGTAHEMYQRTHKSSTSLDDDETEEDAEGDEHSHSSGGKVAGLKVAGRMSRNAARVGCIADALFAAELCELIRLAPPSLTAEEDVEEEKGVLYNMEEEEEEGTLASWTGRRVVLNTTIHASDGPSYRKKDGLAISVLVIYEPDYSGGAGIGHGGVDDLLSFAKEEIMADDDDDNADDSKPNDNNSTDLNDVAQTSHPSHNRPRGRYLVILSDSSDLPSIVSILDTPPERMRLQNSQRGNGPDRGDGASVCGPLYHMAEQLLKVVGPVLLAKTTAKEASSSDGDGSECDEEDEVGEQGAGADSNNHKSLPAIHFVGYSLAGGIAAIAANILDGSLPMKQGESPSSLSGSSRARTSALCLGPPPCLSSNLQSPFVTSVIHGDDIVCRTSHVTIDHLCDRVRRSIKGGLLGRSVGWMSEAVSLTVSGYRGNKGGKLVVPGKAFLVRPRRIGGGSSSIHEVGGRGREALRASLLWQLNDVLLSKSLWVHHRLDVYIRSLDRVRLKGFADEDPSDDNGNEE
ncbi:hypothetical protein ACHAXR_012832 [Thalassiosira sp. AJA248-18]